MDIHRSNHHCTEHDCGSTGSSSPKFKFRGESVSPVYGIPITLSVCRLSNTCPDGAFPRIARYRAL